MIDLSTLSDTQAEAGVIATLIAHPKFYFHTEYLKPNYFYDMSNASIFWCITELLKQGVENMDALNLTRAINGNAAIKRKLSEYNINDMNEYISLSQYAARHTLEEYKPLVNSVVSLSYKRDMIRLTGELQNSCNNKDISLSQMNHNITDKLNGLTEKYLFSNEVEVFGKRVDDLWSRLNEKAATGDYGIPSKFPSLNEYVRYEHGELVLLKARMKRGKSALFLNEITHKLINGVPTACFDTEMSDERFYERMLANLSGIEIKKIKTGDYSDDDKQKLIKANDFIKKAPFVHMYIPSMSDDELFSICKILKNKINLEFVVYDYIKPEKASDASLTSAYLGAKCDFLKNIIAGELELAVLAGAQLNRGNEVADSDKIERYISTSILWREKTSEEIAQDGGLDAGNYCMRVDLNRNGEMMDEDERINYTFDGSVMRIVEANKQQTQATPFS